MLFKKYIQAEDLLKITNFKEIMNTMPTLLLCSLYLHFNSKYIILINIDNIIQSFLNNQINVITLKNILFQWTEFNNTQKLY